MKKVKTAVYALLFMLCLIPAGTVFADCPDIDFDCYNSHNVKMGSASTGQCFRLSSLDCWPCNCGGSNSYCFGAIEARKCNSNFSACDNNCYACFDDGKCYDKNGDPVARVKQ